MASKGPFVVLTLDFVVAISALRISGSYLELDDEPESTRRNTTPSLAALPSSLLFCQPHHKPSPPITPRSPHMAGVGLLPIFQISPHPSKAGKGNSAVKYSPKSVYWRGQSTPCISKVSICSRLTHLTLAPKHARSLQRCGFLRFQRHWTELKGQASHKGLLYLFFLRLPHWVNNPLNV